MTRRDNGLFAGAALAGFLLAVFQLWYVALPLKEAALFDLCRWTEYLDCFESLHENGVTLLWILAALAAVLLVEVSLVALAAGAEPPRADAWRGIARLASFPATGLVICVLLSDLMDYRKTSPSTVLLLLLSLGQNVVALVQRRGFRLRDAGLVPFAVAAVASLFGFFLAGAPGHARAADLAETHYDAAPPAVIVPDFEQQIPRQGAVALGEARAPIEILLFLDPAEEESKRLLEEALRLRAEDVILQVYLKDRALPADARGVLEAAAAGEPLPAPEPSTLPERQVSAARVTAYPTAIWKGGRQSGGWTLSQILAAARGKRS